MKNSVHGSDDPDRVDGFLKGRHLPKATQGVDSLHRSVSGNKTESMLKNLLKQTALSQMGEFYQTFKKLYQFSTISSRRQR